MAVALFATMNVKKNLPLLLPSFFAPSGTRVLNFSKFEDNMQWYHLQFVLTLPHFVWKMRMTSLYVCFTLNFWTFYQLCFWSCRIWQNAVHAIIPTKLAMFSWRYHHFELIVTFWSFYKNDNLTSKIFTKAPICKRQGKVYRIWCMEDLVQLWRLSKLMWALYTTSYDQDLLI